MNTKDNKVFLVLFSPHTSADLWLYRKTVINCLIKKYALRCGTSLKIKGMTQLLRISWLGHLERMEEDRMPKKIFTQELEGTRRRGWPRKGWKEEVERDLQVLGVRRWTELVADRKNGRTLFDRPKPIKGCSANGRRRRTVVLKFPCSRIGNHSVDSRIKALVVAIFCLVYLTFYRLK